MLTAPLFVHFFPGAVACHIWPSRASIDHGKARDAFSVARIELDAAGQPLTAIIAGNSHLVSRDRPLDVTLFPGLWLITAGNPLLLDLGGSLYLSVGEDKAVAKFYSLPAALAALAPKALPSPAPRSAQRRIPSPDEFGLPPLQGSPGQVEWASEIRAIIAAAAPGSPLLRNDDANFWLDDRQILLDLAGRDPSALMADTADD